MYYLHHDGMSFSAAFHPYSRRARQTVGGENVSMAVRRVLETLEGMHPGQAADTVAAAFSVTFEVS